MGIRFSYITNCGVDDKLFESGVKNFVACVNVVKEFTDTRILQISTRPAGFWSVMCNEGELLERFGTQLHPITVSELAAKVLRLEAERDAEVEDTAAYIKNNMVVRVPEADVVRIAALKTAMKRYALAHGCNAIAMFKDYSITREKSEYIERIEPNGKSHRLYMEYFEV